MYTERKLAESICILTNDDGKLNLAQVCETVQGVEESTTKFSSVTVE